MRPNLRKQKPVREYTTKASAEARVTKLQGLGFTEVTIKSGFFKRNRRGGITELKPPVTLLTSDLHLNHSNIATYCDRPANFTELILKNWKQMARPQDTTICLGDVAIGNKKAVKDMLADIPGRKVLVRGNHDTQHSASWWMNNGFDFACDAMVYRGMWLTHKPAQVLPEGCVYNVFGHLHNIWHGFTPNGGLPEGQKKLHHPWQRLFAIEYTSYKPVEFDEFITHPDKYLARGLNAKARENGTQS